jgi:hypothetical protein
MTFRSTACEASAQVTVIRRLDDIPEISRWRTGGDGVSRSGPGVQFCAGGS